MARLASAAATPSSLLSAITNSSPSLELQALESDQQLGGGLAVAAKRDHDAHGRARRQSVGVTR